MRKNTEFNSTETCFTRTNRINELAYLMNGESLIKQSWKHVYIHGVELCEAIVYSNKDFDQWYQEVSRSV